MIADELRARTRQFALDVLALGAKLGNDDVARTVRPQLLRAATSVAANYRAVCRARSRREFVSRMAVVVEEIDETELWLDFLMTSHTGPADRITAARSEAAELRAIMSRSYATAKRNLGNKNRTNEGLNE